MNAAIIGGGLAGCAAAYRLSSLGLDITLYEKETQLASGGSGNFAAMYHRYLHSSSRSPMSLFMREAHTSFEGATKELEAENLRNDVGVFQFPATGRLKKLIANGDHEEEVVGTNELSEILGHEATSPAFYFADGGWVDPRKLCKTYIQRSNARVEFSNHIEIFRKDGKWLGKYDYLILANSMMAKDYLSNYNLSLSPLKGQVFWHKRTSNLNFCLAYDGYLTPCIGGYHMLGATFEREKEDIEFEEARNSEVVGRLDKWIPGLVDPSSFSGKGRASVRAVSYDKIPYIGEIDENCFTTIAHGSRGVVSSIWGADALAGLISGKSLLSETVLKLTSPLRRAL